MWVLFSFTPTRITMVAAVSEHERIFADFHMGFRNYLIALLLKNKYRPKN